MSRIHQPLDTNELDLQWINYKASVSLCEMFSDDRDSVKHWEKEARSSLDFVTKSAAPYVVSMRAGGCDWKTVAEVLSLPQEAIETIKLSDYMIFAIEDWILRIGKAQFAYEVSTYKVRAGNDNTAANRPEYLHKTFSISKESGLKLMKVMVHRGDL